MRSPIRFFAAAAILLATATVAAQVYKWVDKDGKVQYSDQPPPASAGKIDAKKVVDSPSATGAASAPATGAAAAPKSAVDVSKDADKRRKEQAKKDDEAAKKSADDTKRAAEESENCKSARTALRDLESGRPQVRYTESGERNILSDEQRQAEMSRAREIVANSCK